jgi:hypothetical protein
MAVGALHAAELQHTMKTNITYAAREVARKHNAHVECGMAGNGKLVFGLDGSGGAWYGDNSYGFGDDCFVVQVRWGKISAARAQAMLDEVLSEPYALIGGAA